jgi:porphobilinogen synthase
MPTAKYPQVRLRRYRRTEALRALTALPSPPARHFIWPVVLTEGSNIREPISALPGQHLLSIDSLLREFDNPNNHELGGVLLFAKIDRSMKTPDGSFAWHEEGLVQQGIRQLKCHFPSLNVFSDVGLSGYTNHGNNGVMSVGNEYIDNEKTISALTRIAQSHADAGADCVAPSAMMDGQVQQIRQRLDEAEHQQTLIMSYAAKFASDLYDPFPVWDNKEVSHNSKSGAFINNCPLMQTYCTASNNPKLAIREAIMDESEGADIVMVKPALFYLDIVTELKHLLQAPLAVYNVSGEYAMIHASADRGWCDKFTLAREALYSFHRAGADIIISYWANQYNTIFHQERF